MAENSKIEWTTHTFNPIWGCVKVSDGCKNCYASTFSKRVGQDIWGVDKPRRTFGEKHWNEPLKWNKDAAGAGERHRVFCASMTDVFMDDPYMIEAHPRLWKLIEATPHLDWLLLTKRPENILKMIPEHWRAQLPFNVWVGTSVENQKAANERIPHLIQVPAVVRFLSCEPLLGEVDLSLYIGDYDCHACGYRGFDVGDEYECPTCEERYSAENEGCPHCGEQSDENLTCPRCGSSEGGTGTFGKFNTNLYWEETDGIHWVIVGGESGAHARPMQIEWAESLRSQCEEGGVKFFMKQLGGVRDKRHDLEQFPESLRVREFPTSDTLTAKAQT